MDSGAIDPKEVEFHTTSYADHNGRLFWWKGELYRGIVPEKSDFYHRFLEGGVAQRLMERGLLVETEETPFSLPEYPLILKHHLLPYVSYVYEWASLMIKDAALLWLDIAIELAKEGLALQDAHPWNILFNACKPIYVDFGSIVSARARPEDEFYRFFVYPLRLMNCGYSRIARRLIHDYEQGVQAFEAEALTRDPITCVTRDLRSAAHRLIPKALRPTLKKLIYYRFSPSHCTPESRVDFFKALKAEIESIPMELPESTSSNYNDKGCFPPFSPCSTWTAKHRIIYEILRKIKPCSVLDIGSNCGRYSQLAAGFGMNIVAFDKDETAVNRLYCEAKNQNLSILPLVMDFCEISPGNQAEPPCADRLRCDVVLGLSLVHHLVFKNCLRFNKIVQRFVVFTKRRLIVEFIPKEDQLVSQWWSSQYAWYTLEGFIAELRKHFRSVLVHPSDPKPRVVLVCDK